MPGIKPREKVRREWSSNLAYAIGLLTTDGSLSSDRRHIDFTSKDVQQLKNLLKCLGIKNKIGLKCSGYSSKKYSRIQFGDVMFYQFLLDIGLLPAKSKILGALKIPQQYFFDFLRGCHDGDGTFYSYYDPRWRSSFMFYTVFISASPPHLKWIQIMLSRLLKVKGHTTHDPQKNTYQLKYAKRESIKILKKMYHDKKIICLERKRLKIRNALRIVGISL